MLGLCPTHLILLDLKTIIMLGEESRQSDILNQKTKYALLSYTIGRKKYVPGRGLASGVGVLSPVQDMSRKTVKSMKNVTSE
jgi:hypothetical protein